MKNKIKIEVVYINEFLKFHKAFTTIEGIKIKKFFEEIELNNIIPNYCKKNNRIGIYGKLVTDNYILKDKDRVEIYEPVIIDPKIKRKKLTARKKVDK